MFFLTTQPFYRDQFYEAYPGNPLVLQLPDDEEPSPDWWPLDEKSAVASRKVTDRLKLPTKKLLTDVGTAGAIVLPPRPKQRTSEDEVPVMPGAAKLSPNTLAEIQRGSPTGPRLSDRDPAKR
jgi:hypothetical protein